MQAMSAAWLTMFAAKLSAKREAVGKVVVCRARSCRHAMALQLKAVYARANPTQALLAALQAASDTELVQVLGWCKHRNV
jgi:hypothetical protein